MAIKQWFKEHKQITIVVVVTFFVLCFFFLFYQIYLSDVQDDKIEDCLTPIAHQFCKSKGGVIEDVYPHSFSCFFGREINRYSFYEGEILKCKEEVDNEKNKRG